MFFITIEKIAAQFYLAAATVPYHNQKIKYVEKRPLHVFYYLQLRHIIIVLTSLYHVQEQYTIVFEQYLSLRAAT
jgi:hypothetical protein